MDPLVKRRTASAERKSSMGSDHSLILTLIRKTSEPLSSHSNAESSPILTSSVDHHDLNPLLLTLKDLNSGKCSIWNNVASSHLSLGRMRGLKDPSGSLWQPSTVFFSFKQICPRGCSLPMWLSCHTPKKSEWLFTSQYCFGLLQTHCCISFKACQMWGSGHVYLASLVFSKM